MESKNIILRESEIEDVEKFYKWELNPEVNKFFSIRDGQTLDEVKEKFLHDENDPTARQFSIIEKATGDMIGRIVLADIIEGWKGEIWRIYIGDLSKRGKGLGKESMQLIMKYCFDELKFERLYLDHYTGNPAGFLYQKLGFQYEGVLRKNCRKNGKLYDVHLMSILRDEYY